MTRKFLWTLLAALGLLLLILDTKTALFGASEGIELCIRTVIPSLFPFFVLSILLTSSLSGKSVAVLRPLGILCKIPKGAESILLVGMLGGYPTGAQCVAQAYHSGAISKNDAQRMLGFCNLAGPAFIFGIVAGKFSSPHTAWILWLIHILSAILVGFLLPGEPGVPVNLNESNMTTPTKALQRSIQITANVCGWIIFFRVVIAFLSRWVLWLLPQTVQVALTGMLELSNGCCGLGAINSEGLRFIVASGILAFGGLCVFMQTAFAASGFSMKTYAFCKILQTFLSFFIAAITQIFLYSRTDRPPISLLIWLTLVAGMGICVKFLRRKQKNSSISQPFSV